MGQEKDWYRTWFNSPYYHPLYAHRDDVEAKGFVDRLVAELALPAGANVLDLACGRGRHAVRLHANGLNVTGVDLSPESIAFARRSEQEGLRFEVHDMREVLEEEGFDAVFNLFTSFGYFEHEAEDQSVIDAVFASLRSGGKFVLDFLNPKLKGLQLESEAVKMIDGQEFAISKRVEQGTFVKGIRVNGEYYFEERVRAFESEDLQRMMQHAGFRVKKVFGNYALDPFDSELSDRTILICEK